MRSYPHTINTIYLVHTLFIIVHQTDMHIGVRMWSTSAVGFVEKSGAEKWGTWAYVIKFSGEWW
jgi:hypothetical protein